MSSTLRERAESFLVSLSWLAASEAALRVIRILSTIVVARLLVPEDYGIAAVAVTAHELVFVLARNGLSVRLIQCGSERLHEIAHVAYRLNLLGAGVLFLLQCLAAGPLAAHYDDPRLGTMIVCLAGVHLIAPLSLLPFSLLQREKRLGELAKANLATVGLDNVLSVCLALAGLGAWALIVPKLLVAPVWTVLLRRARPYLSRPRKGAPLPWKETARFGLPILGTELAKAARAHLDYLLVGSFLGVEALGLYFFAYNAGLGISSALIRAFSTAILPHLCDGRPALSELRRSYRIVFAVAVPLVLVQCLAAPFYVPLLFGESWRPAIPVLVLICLSAVPRVLEEGSSQLLRARGLTGLDLRWNALFSALVLGAVLIGLRGGLVGVGFAVLLTHALALPLVAAWVPSVVGREATTLPSEEEAYA